jgi:hypothetical protein
MCRAPTGRTISRHRAADRHRLIIRITEAEFRPEGI